MVGRIILLVAAFIVAGLGALLVFLYAQQADERALRDLDPIDVLVVEQDVAAGTSLEAAIQAGSFVRIKRPSAVVPEGFLAETEESAGLVVLTNLYRGEVLLAQKVGDPSSLERLPIPDGRLATSFTLEDPNRVAGFLAPGSRVAVFVTQAAVETEQVDPVTGATTTTTGDEQTRLLLPDAQVIAIGGTTTQTITTTTPDGQQTTEQNLSLLTLALTQTESEKMVLGQTLGELYLSLLTDTSVIQPGAGVTANSLFDVAP